MKSIALAWIFSGKNTMKTRVISFEALIFSNPGIQGTIGQQVEIPDFHSRRHQKITENLLGIKLNNLRSDRGQLKDKREIERMIPGLSRSKNVSELVDS